MAKNKAVHFDVSGTIGGLTYVKTRNGKYVRMPRGSFTPVEINEAFKAVNSRTITINKAAKLVHDAIKAYAGIFKQGNLWQQILKRIRTSVDDDLVNLLKPVEGLEVHEDHQLQQIMPGLTVEVAHTAGIITMRLDAVYAPDFRLPDTPDCYYYELYALFISEEQRPINTEQINTGWIPMKNPRLQFEMSFAAPANAKYYVLMLKTQAGIKEKEIGDFRAMGIRVMKIGSI